MESARPAAHALRAPFQVRDFRFLLLGQLVAGTLGPIVFVGQLLWALDQAPSGWEVVTVGAVGTLRGVGTLTFGLYAGALADRFDRRRLLLVLQVTAVVLALLSATVAHWGDGEVWGLVGLYALTLGLAAVQPADTATRNAVVAELLGPATQTGLGALQVVMQGPALLTLLFSGDILSALDFSGTFVVVAGAFGLNALVLLPLHYRSTFVDVVGAPALGLRRTAARALHDVRLGARYARGDRLLFWTIVLLVASQAATFPLVTNLGPAWLTEVLDVPGTRLGRIQWPWVLSGALAALILTGMPVLERKTRLVLVGATVFPLALLVYAVPQTLTAAFVANFGFGASQSGTLVATIALVQERVPNEMRGRVMSLVQLNMGTAQLLTLPIAALGQAVSLTVLFPTIGVMSLALVLVIALTHPDLWSTRAGPHEGAPVGALALGDAGLPEATAES